MIPLADLGTLSILLGFGGILAYSALDVQTIVPFILTFISVPPSIANKSSLKQYCTHCIEERYLNLPGIIPPRSLFIRFPIIILELTNRVDVSVRKIIPYWY